MRVPASTDLHSIENQWLRQPGAGLLRGVPGSLPAHALLLSLAFGRAEYGLPGLVVPWQERRRAVSALRVVVRSGTPASRVRDTSMGRWCTACGRLRSFRPHPTADDP